MKCTICGHSTLPGAMLCGPCRAALKRARYLSVQDAAPSSMMQARSRRSRARVAATASPLASPSAAKVLAAHTAATLSATAAATPGMPLWRTLAIAVAAVAALGVVAYMGQAPARDPVPVAQPAAPAGTRVVNVGAMPAPVNAGTAGAQAAPPATNSVLVSSSPADEAPPPASKPARTQRVPASAPARPADSTMLSAGTAGAAYEMVPEPPRPAPIAPPAPAAAPPPPPDRWQTMRDDLARCDREGGVGGFICDQRVRLATCEGYWGRVPQCPLPPENPR